MRALNTHFDRYLCFFFFAEHFIVQRIILNLDCLALRTLWTVDRVRVCVPTPGCMWNVVCLDCSAPLPSIRLYFRPLPFKKYSIFCILVKVCVGRLFWLASNLPIFSAVFALTVPAVLTAPLTNNINDEPQTIGMEARKLRALLVKITEYEWIK